MKDALAIGDDGGSGYLFLMLSQRFYGQVYYAYHDELRSSSADWEAGVDALPEYMGLVSHSFTELGELIERTPTD
jgi:hypothetical protein